MDIAPFATGRLIFHPVTKKESELIIEKNMNLIIIHLKIIKTNNVDVCCLKKTYLNLMFVYIFLMLTIYCGNELFILKDVTLTKDN